MFGYGSRPEIFKEWTLLKTHPEPKHKLGYLLGKEAADPLGHGGRLFFSLDGGNFSGLVSLGP